MVPTTLENFLSKIEEGYCKFRNPYHNNLHATDVAQTVHYMLCQTGLMVRFFLFLLRKVDCYTNHKKESQIKSFFKYISIEQNTIK